MTAWSAHSFANRRCPNPAFLLGLARFIAARLAQFAAKFVREGRVKYRSHHRRRRDDDEGRDGKVWAIGF